MCSSSGGSSSGGGVAAENQPSEQLSLNSKLFDIRKIICGTFCLHET